MSCATELLAPRDVPATPERIDAILAVEREVVRDVFARETGDALLRRFDEGLRALAGG